MSLLNPHMNEKLRLPPHDVYIGTDPPKRFLDTLSLQVFCDRITKEGISYAVVGPAGTRLTYY